MYTTRTGLVLGFHGCDEAIAQRVISNDAYLRESQNIHDWLGHGVYFWENSPERALEFATFLRDNPSRSQNPIIKPAVIGAVIDLGFCFDLLDYGSLQILKTSYHVFKSIWENTGRSIPQNLMVGNSNDLLLRNLDCAVFETLHKFRIDNNEQPYDSVRGVFWEGSELYPNAGFREKDHIQLCIRNPNCIKGFFNPRKFNPKYNKV